MCERTALSRAYLEQAELSTTEAIITPPGHAARIIFALFNTLALAAAVVLLGFSTWLMDWHLSALLPDVIVIGAIALGAAVVTCSLLGCLGAACSSREALLLYTFLLLPCLVVTAGVTGLSVAGANAAVATLEELGHSEQVSLAAIGRGARPYERPSLSSGSSEEMLRTLYSGWESIYLDCAPAATVACEGGSGEGGSGSGSGAPTNSSGCGSRAMTAADYVVMDSGAFACSSDEARGAGFGTWASDECIQGADELTVANCSLVVSALTNTSGAGSEGALWLFCACAHAIADDIPARTRGVEASMQTMCALLALLLLVDAFTLREVAKRA